MKTKQIDTNASRYRNKPKHGTEEEYRRQETKALGRKCEKHTNERLQTKNTYNNGARAFNIDFSLINSINARNTQQRTAWQRTN